MGHTYITSGEGVPGEDWPFSPAVVAGNPCFISGQPAIDPETGEYRPGTIEQEFKQAFANIRNIAKAGALPLGCKVEVRAIAAHG
jgi:2-iminobutanoate/2-iminopropanoate deaminase